MPLGLFGVLGVAFVILKLAGIITWSWWWVTAPFWGSFLAWLIIVTIYAIVCTNTVFLFNKGPRRR